MDEVVGKVNGPVNSPYYKNAGKLQHRLVAYGASKNVSNGTRQLVKKKKRCLRFGPNGRTVTVKDLNCSGRNSPMPDWVKLVI